MEPLKDAKTDLTEEFSFLPLIAQLLQNVKDSKSDEVVEIVRKLHDKFDQARNLVTQQLPAINNNEQQQQEEHELLKKKLEYQK